MTTDISTAKALVADFQSALDSAAQGAETQAVCAEFLAPDHSYQGVRPIYDLKGPGALADVLWTPYKSSLTTHQRRHDIVFASTNHLRADGAHWVVCMGNHLGDMTGDWLGIPAQNKTVFMPYATFYRVEGARIAETIEFLDILAVLTQAGLNTTIDHQPGAYIMSPGPRTHDGLGPHSEAETAATFKMTIDMLDDLADSDYTSPPHHIPKFWHEDMNWFGPCGIGASMGYPGYKRGHTQPFADGLDITEILDWNLAFAEGNFSAVLWWPCLKMYNKGGYNGVPANDRLAEMRVVDLYRRDGDKLAENWIFIDMLHFLADQGVDLLERDQ